MRVRNFVLWGAAVLTAFSAQAQTSQEAPEAPSYQIKISRSRDDANVQAAPHTGDGPADFYLFIDGPEKTKGAEFGIAIVGGTLDAYIIDSEKAWMPLPLENPYPGTIAQVRVGSEGCAETPSYLGRMLVTPDVPGGEVILDVIPSLRAEQAVVLDCNLTTVQGFRAFPASANGPAPKAHAVRGVAEDAANAGTATGGTQ